MTTGRELSSVSKFFLRVLAALLVVNLSAAAVIIFIAYAFSSDSLSNQAKESITQQVSVFAESLVDERLKDVLVMLKALESSQNMEDFLQVSEAERLILARRIERQFIQLQKDNADILALYYYNEDGEIKIGARGKARLMVSRGKPAKKHDLILQRAEPLFEQLRETPLILSSGGMEWFIPPRDATITGPYRREDGGYSLLAGLAKLDKNTGLFGGMLLAHFNLDNWLADLGRLRIQDHSPVWVYDDQGQVLLRRDEAEPHDHYLDPASILPQQKFIDTQVIENDQGLVVFRDIPLGEDRNSIRLVFSVPANLLVQGLEPAIDFFTWVLVFSIVSLVVLSYFISRLLVRPFNELAIARNKLVTAQNLARIGHWDWHKATRTMGLSENAISILGLTTYAGSIEFDELLQRVHEDDRATLEKLVERAVDKGESASLEYRLISPSGEEIFIHQAIDVIEQDNSRVIGTVQDITERRRTEARIRELAYHDSVTGLANRSLLDEIAEHALQTAKLRNRKMAVVFLDLDQFKRVNDTLGHDAGDELLRQVADRLIECVRPSDTVSAASVSPPIEDMVARLGGDEFIILLPNLLQLDDAIAVAERIQHALNEPFEIHGKEILSGGSLGISVYPDHGSSVKDLLRLADTAMYYAKAQGRNRYVLYNPKIDAHHQNRLSIEVAMSRAVGNGEFELYYQPRYSIDGSRIKSFEALLRWNDPDKGLVMPDEFIYIAEENGSIVQIGEWVIETACRQLADWQQEFSADLGVSVNISPVQFLARNLVENIAKVMKASKITPGSLELELTENALFKDVETGVKISQQLKALGLSLSIDDFGTGYSSLQLLSRLPVDTLKIDKSFVQNMLQQGDDEMIVQSFILLGKNLGLRVVAEGVEEQGQWLALRERGCDEMQGYYFARPCRQQEARQLLLDQYRVEKAL